MMHWQPANLQSLETATHGVRHSPGRAGEESEYLAYRKTPGLGLLIGVFTTQEAAQLFCDTASEQAQLAMAAFYAKRAVAWIDTQQSLRLAP